MLGLGREATTEEKAMEDGVDGMKLEMKKIWDGLGLGL